MILLRLLHIFTGHQKNLLIHEVVDGVIVSAGWKCKCGKGKVIRYDD